MHHKNKHHADKGKEQIGQEINGQRVMLFGGQLFLINVCQRVGENPQDDGDGGQNGFHCE